MVLFTLVSWPAGTESLSILEIYNSVYFVPLRFFVPFTTPFVFVFFLDFGYQCFHPRRKWLDGKFALHELESDSPNKDNLHFLSRHLFYMSQVTLYALPVTWYLSRVLVRCLFSFQGSDAFSQSGLYSNHQDIGPRYAVCSTLSSP